jgi:hypothetical protein
MLSDKKMEKVASKHRHMRQAVAEEVCVDAWVHVVVVITLARAEEEGTRDAHQTLATPMAEAALAWPQIQDHTVKCALRKGTSPVNVGICLMILMCLMSVMQEQPSLPMV